MTLDRFFKSYSLDGYSITGNRRVRLCRILGVTENDARRLFVEWLASRQDLMDSLSFFRIHTDTVGQKHESVLTACSCGKS